jgi:hypothetical protein
MCWSPSGLIIEPSIIIEKIECDLDDSLFIFVSPIDLDLPPILFNNLLEAYPLVR